MDESPDRETMLAASEEFYNRRKALSDALAVLNTSRGGREALWSFALTRWTAALRSWKKCVTAPRPNPCFYSTYCRYRQFRRSIRV